MTDTYVSSTMRSAYFFYAGCAGLKWNDARRLTVLGRRWKRYLERDRAGLFIRIKAATLKMQIEDVLERYQKIAPDMKIEYENRLELHIPVGAKTVMLYPGCEEMSHVIGVVK